MIHIYAALAEKERAMISDRTRLALAAKKGPGRRVGEPDQSRGRAGEGSGGGQGGGARRWRERASDRALVAGGGSDRVPIARALNDRGVRTARGGEWHESTVRNLLAGCERRRPQRGTWSRNRAANRARGSHLADACSLTAKF
jgi:hypothetical protein